MADNNNSQHIHKCSGQYMFIVDKYFRKFLRDSLKPYHMTGAEGMAILALYGRNIMGNRTLGCTQDELNEELHYDKAAITRALKCLEEKKMVIRTKNKTDKRSYFFTISNDGMEMLPILVRILVRWEKEIFKGVAEQDKEAFSLTLQTITNNAENLSI